MSKGKRFGTQEDLSLAVLNKIRCNVYSDFAVLVEGHKGLKCFGGQKIVFKASKRQNLVILGKNLVVKQLAVGYALIAGEIEGVHYEDIG